MIPVIIILAAIGFGISLYDYIIEQKIKRTPDYKPFCDISEKISCTKPMKSPYAHMFFVSNALIGMIYYSLIGILAFLGTAKLLLIATIGGCIASCILAYFLFFKIKSLCLICVSLYIVNFAMLFFIVTAH